MPRFSIILPCHNAEATLEATLHSVRAQSYTDWELICVDDGSTDWTGAILNKWAQKDSRFVVITLTGEGPSRARNFGARCAQGEILCFLDADDMWVPEKLGLLDRAFQEKDVDGVFGKVAFFSAVGQPSTFSTVPKQALTVPMLMGENPVCTMSNISLRRELFNRSEGLATDFVHNEDLEWLIRLVGMGAHIKGMDAFHVWYRTTQGGLSSDLKAMAQSRRRALRTAERFGYKPSATTEAIYLRYLARRALRLNQTGLSALRYALSGLAKSPTAFLFPLHRGALTALAALCAPVMPNALRLALFAK